MDSPKYLRTPHLMWSPGRGSDDKVATSVDRLLNAPIVITEKLDGGNTSFEASGCFARTHAGAPTHPSFDLLKAFHSQIKYKIPTGIQLFGENCYALHSIAYNELPGYFLLFNVRDLNYQPARWLDWSEVELWSQEIGVPTVPVLFRGTVSSENELQELTEDLAAQPSACGGKREGVVVRIESNFTDLDFSNCIMKSVRKGHVQTSEHWSHQEIIKNKLKI
jgi:hypothetical protein